MTARPRDCDRKVRSPGGGVNGLTPHLVSLAALSTGVGAVMVRLGLHKGRLEPRRVARRCPSCGRSTNRRVCRGCSH